MISDRENLAMQIIRNRLAASICHVLTGVLCLTFPSTKTAATTVIDDFVAGPITVVGPTTQVQSGLDPAHVLGGSRTMNVGQFGNGSVLSIDTADGLRFASSGNGYFDLKYDFAITGGVDLTADGQDRIRIQFGDVQTTYTPIGIYMTLPPNSSSNGVSLAIQNWDGLILEVPFTAFPTSPTSAQNLTVSVARNPPGAAFVVRSITTASTPLVGDYTRDGTVSIDDYDTWRQFFGVSTRNGVSWAIASADGNADGRVDAADYVLWRNSMNAMPSAIGGSQSVPEPTEAALLSFVLVTMMLRRLRHPAR